MPHGDHSLEPKNEPMNPDKTSKGSGLFDDATDLRDLTPLTPFGEA